MHTRLGFRATPSLPGTAVFASNRKLHFPPLADFEPKGAVARMYGAYRAREGVSERALFVIDGGIVHTFVPRDRALVKRIVRRVVHARRAAVGGRWRPSAVSRPAPPAHTR